MTETSVFKLTNFWHTNFLHFYGGVLQREYVIMSPEIELSVSWYVASQDPYQSSNSCTQYTDSQPRKLGSWLRRTLCCCQLLGITVTFFSKSPCSCIVCVASMLMANVALMIISTYSDPFGVYTVEYFIPVRFFVTGILPSAPFMLGMHSASFVALDLNKSVFRERKHVNAM